MKSKPKPFAPWLFILTLCLGVYLLKLYNDVDRQYAQVVSQAVAAEVRLQGAEAEQARLQRQVEALHTDAEIERQARERLGLIREGEIPVLVQPRIEH